MLFRSAAKAVDGYSTKWLMDSGASHHITSFRDDFATYKAYPTPLLFRTAQDGDAGIVQGLGEGTVRAYVEIDGHRKLVEIKHVCYVPAAGTCLFSTGVIERTSSFIYQGGGKMSVYNSVPKG